MQLHCKHLTYNDCQVLCIFMFFYLAFLVFQFVNLILSKKKKKQKVHCSVRRPIVQSEGPLLEFSQKVYCCSSVRRSIVGVLLEGPLLEFTQKVHCWSSLRRSFVQSEVLLFSQKVHCRSSARRSTIGVQLEGPLLEFSQKVHC